MGADTEIYLGLDLGSTASKGLLLGGDDVLAKKVLDTTPDVRGLAGEMASGLYQAAGVDESDVAGAVVTGYGRRLADFGDIVMTDHNQLFQ